MPVVCSIDVQRAAISSDAFFSQQHEILQIMAQYADERGSQVD